MSTATVAGGGEAMPLPGAPGPPQRSDGAGVPDRPGRAPLVQSADHALRLLRAVGQRGSIRVAEAAQLLEVVPSTAHRLLATLGHQGFVVQERRGGTYLPGPAIAELALRGRPEIDLPRVAGPALEWLRDETQETASLVVLEQTLVRFVASIDGPRSLRVSARTGAVLPAHCVSGGKVLLAALGDHDLAERYPDEHFEGRSPRSITSRRRLEAELEEVRRRGFGTNFDEGDTGIGGVAVVVRGLGAEEPVAALCLAAPIARLRSKKAAAALVPLLEAARDQLEAVLNGTVGAGSAGSG